MLDPPQFEQLAESLVQSRDDIAVTYRDEDRVGRRPVAPTLQSQGARQLFADFEGGCLLAFDGERVVSRIAAVPTEGLRRFQRQVKRLVIIAVDQIDLGAKDQQLGDFRRRGSLGCQDHSRLAGRRCHTRQRRPGVAR